MLCVVRCVRDVTVCDACAARGVRTSPDLKVAVAAEYHAAAVVAGKGGGYTMGKQLEAEGAAAGFHAARKENSGSLDTGPDLEDDEGGVNGVDAWQSTSEGKGDSMSARQSDTGG